MNCQNAKRLALGTVQFGLPYGIANATGQVSGEAATRILQTAKQHGLNTLDTAISYGDSEQVLGDTGVADWEIVSKLPALPDNVADISEWVQSQLTQSLKRLGVNSLAGLLLHRPDQLLSAQGPALYQALLDAKTAGLTKKIGVSIYDPQELEKLWTQFDKFDLIQAPLNVFDRRLFQSGWLDRLQEQNIEVHTRSAFLQGLLLLPPSQRPTHFAAWRELWQRWDQWLTESETDALSACINYPLALQGVDRVVIGVDSLEQLQQILAALESNSQIAPAELQCKDLQLINPANWPSS